MKNAKIIYFMIFLVLIVLLGTGLVQAQESMTTQLQSVLEDAVNSPETIFPGALLHVSSPDIKTWNGAAGLGNIETETAMRADDKFRAGSTIKPMIAVVILQLVEEGKFSLDDPMTAVLPESVTTKFAYSNQITVRMLLNHTSGMADCIEPVVNEIIANPAKVWEVDEWLNVASAQEPYFAPGEDWTYSNTDYILLGLVIKQATGRSWRAEFRERIIEKLNLKNTLLPEPGDLSIPGDYAHGYMDLGAGLVDVTGVDPSMADAAGGSALVTTTTDLAIILDAVMAGRLFKNYEILAEMLTLIKLPEGRTPLSGLAGYGLGMMKFLFPGNIEMVGHSGDNPGFSSFAFHLPAEDITISGMVNDMDPLGAYYRILFPALEVLITDFKPVLPELDPASSALQGLLDQQVQEQDILGMAMAVRLADGTVIGKASGYSDPSGDEAWSVDTVSAIGSITKTYTGVIVMQLVEEGKLSLDDTIDTWFPQQPNGDRITVRMLLSHTSGIANYITGENVMEGKWNKEWAPMDLIAEANKIGPVGEPGSKEAHYSNTGYILLGLIIENITGNSWAQEVESRIIEPLDLKDTTFLSKEGVWGGIMVAGYAKTPDGYISTLEIPGYPHASTVWSAGEVVATLSDLMTFASALFDGKLVSKETLAVMAQPLATDVDSGRTWGLGGATLEMGGFRGFGMGGDIPGYHGFFVGVLDTKLIVTALVNTQEGDVIMPSISALEYISQSLSGAPEESGAAREIQAPDYQKVIDEVLQDDRPGIALRVITPEFEVLETRGYVDWENKIPLKEDHLFRVASCTKTFIATLTLMMHFEGRLDLDDTITRYLPESITNRIQYADQITIRQMLNHTSGIFNTGDNPEYWAAQYSDPTKEWTDKEVLEFALDQPAYFEPGSGYAYSNTDYLLAGLILDQDLGHHHSVDVRSRILEPLGLSSTFYEQKEPFDREMLSHGYFDFDGDGIAEDYYGLRIETGHAEGGLVSTAGDLAAFITALATQPDFPSTEYREQFMQELLTIQPVASDEPGQVGTGPGIAEYDYGYGPGYGHSGGIPGYVSHMVYFAAHDVTFAITWNGFDGGFTSFGMVPALFKALIEETFSALGIASTLVDDTSAGNVYEDPAGRFTMPLVGDWTPVETDGTYAKYAFSDMDLAMSLVSIEASDVEGDMPTAMQSVGVDPASLTETYRASWNKWSIFYYDTVSGEGVTVLGQVQDGIGYYIVATGAAALTSNPPEDVMKTIEGFALTGEVVLPSTVAEFESYVNDIVGLRPPALSIAIATTDDLIYAQGFGMADRSEDIQATSDTVYFWGSITKTVTATAIMQLREQGLVDLEAPVSDYLDYVPAQHGITVWNLLTHSSGLPEPRDWLPSHLRLEGQPLPDADVMDRDYYAELTDLMFEPGSQSAYANPDFVTLGQIVAAVSGQSYLEYVREHILGPLGMVNTDFEYSTDSMVTQAAAPATSLSNREAMITIIDDARGLGDAASFFRESDENTAWMNHFIVGEAAGGGLMGPVTEMVRYAQMIVNGGELDGQRILSAESVELLRQEQVSNSGEPLGFGMSWQIRDETEHPYIEHGGGGQGVDALLRVYYKDGFAIALQANSGGYSRQEMMDAAANVVLTMFGGGTQQAEPAPSSTPTSGGVTLQGLLDQQVQEQGILGMAMAVRLADGTVIGKASGYSDPFGEEVWSVDTVSAIGSVTKTYTAVVVMQLVEEGKLSLDDTIDTWFPEQPNGNRITIRMLLSHTSGLHTYINGPQHIVEMKEGKFSNYWAPMDMVAKANKHGPVGEPGSSDAHYSNTNFILLGLIVEEITGNSWAQEVESRIIKSLGLKDTTFLSKEGVLDIMVGGYTKTEDGYINLLEESWYPHPSTVWSAGEIVTTVSDLMTFAGALFDGKLVSKETLAVMAQPLGTDIDSGILWGLGGGTLEMLPPGAFGMGGDIPGYNSFFMGVLDTKLVVTTLCNTQEGNVIMPSMSAFQYISQSLSGVPDEEGTVGNVYQDPEGRFSIPLIGDWIQVKTDGTYALLELSGLPLNMYVVTVESDDLEAGIDAGLRQIDIDPAALTLQDTSKFGNWNIFYYSLGDGKGVTIPAQVKNETTYCLICMGDEALTMNPPDNLVKTVGGFTFTGEEVILPTTVPEFEAYVATVVGDKPPALSIAIALGGDIIYAEGFGLADGPKDMAATPDTVYQWGSTSKIVSATCIMQLYEKGLVDLEAPVSRYLDYFPTEYPITVRQILTHSSGLPEPTDYVPLNLRLEGQSLPDPDLWARRYLDELTGLIFEPGSASAYSGPNSVLVGQIVAEVSGKSYMEYAKENILIPLGMKTTDFTYSSQAMISKAAAGAFSPDEVKSLIAMLDGIRGRGDGADFIREVDGNLAWMNRIHVFAPAGGGLIGPVTEVIRFLGMHLNGGEFEGVRILSPESVSLMQEMQLSTKGTPLGFGLGWEVFDQAEHPYIQHPGDGVGIQALMRLYSNEGLAISIMSNFQGYDYEQVVDAAANVVFSMLGSDAEGDEPAVAFTPPIVDAEGNEVPGSIAVIETVTLGGVEQTVTIRGADTTKPVLLFLHGGPGMPSSPWATWNNVHTDLEENFVFVHWDQRGAGKSYSEELTADDMHVDNFVSDTLELTNILRKEFDQEKIFLWGHSWGSGLGFETLRVNSEPYYAFIASAVRPDWNSTQEMGYEKVLGLAYRAQDADAIQALESIQPFDPTNPEHVGIRGQFLSRYLVGDFHTEGLEEAWLDYVFSDRSSEYPAAYIDQTLAGHGFSRQTIGLEAMTNGYDHAIDFPVSTIPVYFIQGRYDYECPGELAEIYYAALAAPVKDFIWFENSAHDVYYDEPDKFNQELIRIANEVLATVQTVPE